MNKTLVIINREFSTRVRKKSFLLVTILVPLLFLLLYVLLAWMLLGSGDRQRTLLVVNESTIEEPFKAVNNIRFTYVDRIPGEGHAGILERGDYQAIIHVPGDVVEHPEVSVYSLAQVPVELKHELETRLRQEI